MAGGFVFVVGPSGSGKDSLIGYAKTTLAGDESVVFPRRIVTRPSSAHEDHDTLDETAFAEGESAGAFTLCWRAHGLGYAVPKSALQDVQQGRVAVCNISRRMVPWSRIHLPKVTVVEVTAPVELLRERLAGRARIEDGDLNARLTRSLEVWTPVDATIVNDRSIDEAGRELVALITSHITACRADGPVEERLVPRFN